MTSKIKPIVANDYWEDRFNRILIDGEKTQADYEKQLQDVYRAAIAEITKQIDAFYQRYALKNKISLSDAMKALSTEEWKSFHALGKQYKKLWDDVNGDPAYAKQLEVLSQRLQITRLQELEANIRNQLENMYAEINQHRNSTNQLIFEQSFYKTQYTMDIAFGAHISFTQPSSRMLKEAVNQKWMGTSYSDTLWKNKNKLLIKMQQTLPQMFITGKNSQEVAVQFAADMQTSYKASVRLLRTEVNQICNQATMKSYKNLVDKYEYVATLDNRTSLQCQEMDGHVILVSEAQVGVNQPPLHPNCRSTTIPYMKDGINSTRIARDKNDKNIKVPASMTYKEWAAKYGSPIYNKKV